MGRRKCPTWRGRFGKKPIERLIPRDDLRYGERSERIAVKELEFRIWQLTDFYGATSNEDLLRKLLGELDPAFTIIDPLPRKPRGKWRGLPGMEFVELVECIRKHLRADRDPVGKGVTWKNILAELANPTMEITKFEVEFWTEYYGQGMPDFCSMSPEALKANYHSAKEYCRRRERRLGTDRSSCAPRVAVSAPVLGWNAYLARTAPDRKRRKPE